MTHQSHHENERPHHEAGTGHSPHNDRDHVVTATGAMAPAAHRHGPAHDRHEGHSVAMFRDKFWLSLLLTIPVVLLSQDIQQWFGYSLPIVPGIEFVPAVLGTVVFLY